MSAPTIRPAVPPPPAEPDPRRRLSVLGALFAAAGIALIAAVLAAFAT